MQQNHITLRCPTGCAHVKQDVAFALKIHAVRWKTPNNIHGFFMTDEFDSGKSKTQRRPHRPARAHSMDIVAMPFILRLDIVYQTRRTAVWCCVCARVCVIACMRRSPYHTLML